MPRLPRRSAPPVVPPPLPLRPVPLAALAPELLLPLVGATFAELPHPCVECTNRYALLDIVAIA